MLTTRLCLALAIAAASIIDPVDHVQVPARYSYVTTSRHGMFYFKLVPSAEQRGVGIAYKVGNLDGDKRLWSTSGWYAFKVFLSADGKYLVRLGNRPPGNSTSDSHLAVAFYENGELLAEYSTGDLIDPSLELPHGSEGYDYINPEAPIGFRAPPESGTASTPHWFSLVTVNGTRISFDRRTGELTLSEPNAVR